MHGLQQIRAINSWAKSEELKRLAKSQNTGKHEGRIKHDDGACACKKGCKNHVDEN